MHENNTIPQLGENTISPEADEEINSENIKEIQKYSGVETLTIAGLVAIAVAASYFVYTIDILHITSMTRFLWYMFAMLIGPSAYLLIILHIYSVYRSMTTGKKPFFLPLDIFYFTYIILAGITIVSLFYLFQRYQIPINYLTPGWFTAVAFLFTEVALSYTLSQWYVSSTVSIVFPDLNPQVKPPKTITQEIRIKTPTKHVYYYRIHTPLRTKSNPSLWQDSPSYVKYEQRKDHHHPLP